MPTVLNMVIIVWWSYDDVVRYVGGWKKSGGKVKLTKRAS